MALPAVDTRFALTSPMNEAHTSQTGAPSNAWANYYQKINDWLSILLPRAGVTDGSEAKAGDIGEYLTAGGGPVALANNSLIGIASVSLTAGDWDVVGSVAFTTGSGTHTSFACGIDAIDTTNAATFPATIVYQVMNTATHRFNVTATTTVQAVAQAVFTGTVNASGSVRARRVR